MEHHTNYKIIQLLYTEEYKIDCVEKSTKITKKKTEYKTYESIRKINKM